MAREAGNQPGVCDVTEGDRVFQEAGTGQGCENLMGAIKMKNEWCRASRFVNTLK